MQVHGDFCNFIFCNCDNYKKLMALPNKYVAGLAMLATYLKYNSSILQKNSKPLTKQEAMEIVGFSKSVFYTFWNSVTNIGAICEVDGEIHISEEYFFKGKGGNGNFFRIFLHYYRNAYKQGDDCKKCLGLAIKMMIFADSDHNELRVYPTTSHMTVSDLAKAFGCSINAMRLILQKACKVTFLDWTKHEDHIITLKRSGHINKIIAVNPYLFFAGNNVQQFKAEDSFKKEIKERDIKKK